MTLQEKILVAAYRLSSERGLFPVEDLIIRSWKDNPKDFSIKGYTAVYPDSNKVISCLFGQRGIIKGKGWLEAAVFNQYALTDKGKREAEKLLGVAKVNADANGNEQSEEKPTSAKPVKLSNEDSDVVRKMTKTFVYGAMTNGSSGGEIDRVVTFADACSFWGFPSQVKLGEVDKHIEKVAGFLKGLLHSFKDGKVSSLVTSYGQELGIREVLDLGKCHDFLLKKFDRHLNLLRDRKESTRS